MNSITLFVIGFAIVATFIAIPKAYAEDEPEGDKATGDNKSGDSVPGDHQVISAAEYEKGIEEGVAAKNFIVTWISDGNVVFIWNGIAASLIDVVSKLHLKGNTFVRQILYTVVDGLKKIKDEVNDLKTKSLAGVSYLLVGAEESQQKVFEELVLLLGRLNTDPTGILIEVEKLVTSVLNGLAGGDKADELLNILPAGSFPALF